MNPMQIPNSFISNYSKQHYKIIGEHKHSAVKTCLWTRRSLRNQGVCYKQKFYGIQSHRCLQMTPALFWCTFRCEYCWRNIEATLGFEMKDFSIDSPREIVEESIKAQRKLLSGFPGATETLDKKKFKEALNPNQVAISLAGEPTLYKMLSGLINAYHEKDFTTFLVTNGANPSALENLSLPTQLYLSLEAPNKELHKKINKPIVKDTWEKINQSLELLPSINTRKVIRVTALKGLNMDFEMEFAKLIEKSAVDFVEIKGYMFVGYSRKRMQQSNMPLHSEVKSFAERINKHLNYTFVDESRESRVVLLSSGKKRPLIDG
jgi:tRNA wybutosine-synthesizing protein 1